MKTLTFIHVPKTGGSSIVDAAVKKQIDWFMYSDIRKYIAGSYHDRHWGVRHIRKELMDEFKEKYDTFAVVRNVYDMVLSFLFYTYSLGILAKKTGKLTRDQLNKYIVDIMLKHKWFSYTQSYWVISDDYKPTHILKFENFSQEVPELLTKYNIHLDISHINKSDRYYTVKDLYPETIAAINAHYKEDFENFGYEMIDPTTVDAKLFENE